MGSSILAPAAALVAWSLIMLLWVAATRFPAMAKAASAIKKAPPGGRGQDLDGILPPHVQWKSHNYMHLMEQPTIFYPVVIILHIMEAATPLMMAMAWGYVILRVLHSIWQATVNKVIPVRILLFLFSTACLIVLSIKAVMVTL